MMFIGFYVIFGGILSLHTFFIIFVINNFSYPVYNSYLIAFLLQNDITLKPLIILLQINRVLNFSKVNILRLRSTS